MNVIAQYCYRAIKVRSSLAMLVICLTLGLSGCTKTPEWTLFYYPELSVLPDAPLQPDTINGYYDTLEQCQRKAHGLQRLTRSGMSGFDSDANPSGSGVYQCGQQCELNDQSVLICKQLTQ